MMTPNPSPLSRLARYMQLAFQYGGVAFRGYTAYTTVQNNRRAQEMEEARRRAEDQHNRTVIGQMLNPKPSGKLGAARLGTRRDARKAGLVTGGKGVYLGALERATLSYAGHSHITVFAKNRAGKSIYSILPNLAHIRDRSVVVVDPKGGELTWASAEYRSTFSKVIVLNPGGYFELPDTRLNVCDSVIDAVRNRKHPFSRDPARQGPMAAALDVMTTILPIGPDEREPWPKQGAHELGALFLVAMAAITPGRCTLAGLQAFAGRGDDELIKELKMIGESVLAQNVPEGVRALARGNAAMIEAGKSQWSAIRQTLTNALIPFMPGEPVTRSTAMTDFDFGRLKRERITVYIVGDPSEASRRWVALVLAHLFRKVATSRGPERVTFFIDELIALPKIAGLTDAVNLLPGLGVQLASYIQSYEGLIARYGKEFAGTLESGSHVVQYWALSGEEALIKRIEYLSGRMSVATRGVNAAGGTVPTASFGIHESARALLQPEDIQGLRPDQQILRVIGSPAPWFVADLVPYFEIAEYAGVLRDPRELDPSIPLHLFDAESSPPSPPEKE